MMKTIKLTLIALLMLTAFTNCKKDKKEATPKVTIDGTWTGTFDNSVTVRTFIINADKTLKMQNDVAAEIASGTWELDGVKFTTSYTYGDNYGGKSYNAQAVFDNVAGTLSAGTYTQTSIGIGGGGTWSMTKNK